MDLSAALTATIHNLYLCVGLDGAVADDLAELNRDLKLAVHSFLGLRLVVVDHHPVILTAFNPGVRRADIATSLQVRLSVMAAEFSSTDPGSAITFYAGTPGAFVDLAADLTYALGLPARTTLQRRIRRMTGRLDAAVVLDDDLTPTVVSGLTGTEELAVINRAIGILIGNGHEPDEARRELDRRAARAGLTPAAWATQLVRRGHDLGFAAG